METAMHDVFESASKAALIVRPLPIPGESTMGFLLRTAEANGYSSINALFRLARPPLAKLAPLFERDVEEFNMLDSDQGVQCSGRKQTLMQHALPSIYLRSKHARLCPDCINELHHVQAFWELKYAVACPIHRRKALSSCPECGHDINWSRRGLNTCRCGYDFTDACKEATTDQALLTLLELLQAKLMGEPANHDALNYVGFPAFALETVSLATLIGIVGRLENFLPTERRDDNDLQAIESAAEVFSNWPHGFHRYLERVHAPNALMEAKGLRGQFKSFYESFFKNDLPKEEMAFLHEAFVEFGQVWKQAAIHPRLLKEKASNIVGIEGLAKAIGMQPSTARKLVKQGIIPVHAHHPRNGRKLFDLSQQMPFEFAKGKALSLDKAAELLDIPVTILRAYRELGFYRARHLVSPTSLYHEVDVAALKEDLVRDCPMLDYLDELRQTTLHKVMLKKLGDPMVKAGFIAAVKHREIKPLGILGYKPGDLVFDLKQVNEYLSTLATQISDSVSLDDAKFSLGIDENVFTQLIAEGLLDTVITEHGARISIASMKTFSSRYVACRQIAKLKAMPQQDVLDLCSEVGIHPFKLNRQGAMAKNAFLPRDRLELLGIRGVMPHDLKAA